MKNFVWVTVGVIVAIVFFKWDALRVLGEDWIAEHKSLANSIGVDEVGCDVIDDETNLQLASEWQNGGKRRSVERLNAMKAVFDSRTSCKAYHCSSSVVRATRNAIIDYERAIGRDDYVHIRDFDDAAMDAVRKFQLNSRWQAGVSRGDGTHSGVAEGTWEPDAGRVMVGGRAMRVCRCGNCAGSGVVRSVDICSACNGRGRIANPAAQVSDAVSMGVEIATMFGKGRMPRISTPNVAREINCSSCNGQGRLQVTHQCAQCGGSGSIYEP